MNQWRRRHGSVGAGDSVARSFWCSPRALYCWVSVSAACLLLAVCFCLCWQVGTLTVAYHSPGPGEAVGLARLEELCAKVR